jgi:hypothetical protein
MHSLQAFPRRARFQGQEHGPASLRSNREASLCGRCNILLESAIGLHALTIQCAVTQHDHDHVLEGEYLLKDFEVPPGKNVDLVTISFVVRAKTMRPLVLTVATSVATSDTVHSQRYAAWERVFGRFDQ